VISANNLSSISINSPVSRVFSPGILADSKTQNFPIRAEHPSLLPNRFPVRRFLLRADQNRTFPANLVQLHHATTVAKLHSFPCSSL